MISVITPTVRPEGLKIVETALRKQSFTDFEWLIGAKECPDQFPYAIWVEDDFNGGFWTLNRIYNRLFNEARGDLIVSWQDWIWAPKDALQKFWDAYKKTGGIISGVGDQYERVGQYGKPEVKIWSDPRKRLDLGSFYEVNPNDAEWNFCAIPKKAIYDIGGMDEELDFLGFGGDQLQAVERMDGLGYKFYLDQTNESYTIRHDRSKHGGQDYWDTNHVLFNGTYDARKQALIREGMWPRLEFLKQI
jgi:hypothetical protein